VNTAGPSILSHAGRARIIEVCSMSFRIPYFGKGVKSTTKKKSRSAPVRDIKKAKNKTKTRPYQWRHVHDVAQSSVLEYYSSTKLLELAGEAQTWSGGYRTCMQTVLECSTVDKEKC